MVTLLDLLLFSLGWIVFVYLVNCAFAKKVKKIKIKPLILYVTTVAMIGTFGEVFWDSLYHKVFDYPLWEYYIYPIHNGYTSYFASVLWGLYGLHLYLLYDTIHQKYKKAIKYLPIIFAVEALLIEALVSVSFKLIFDQWVYYYLPEGLWHVSAFQNFPLYFLAGYVIAGTLKRFARDPIFFTLMNISLVTVLDFLV